PISSASPADSKYLRSEMRIYKSNKKTLNAKGKSKGKGKGKDKSYIPKPKKLKPYAKEHPRKNDTCHHYKEVDHWKRNCPTYLDELIKKKQVGTTSSLGIPHEKFYNSLGSAPNHCSVVWARLGVANRSLEE
nr:hypothetical protein [Tanacetum cinerariifolium]